MDQSPDLNLIDAKTLADHLSISESHVRRMTRRRIIPSYSLGRKCRRYRLKEVEECLAHLRVAERSPEEQRFARRFQA